MLDQLLQDILKIDDILLVVKSNGAVSEIKSNNLSFRQKNPWITLGDNEGPCHMHINSDSIKRAEFVTEKKETRTSYSVRFYDDKDDRILGAFFTKMYKDKEYQQPDSARVQTFNQLAQKYGNNITF